MKTTTLLISMFSLLAVQLVAAPLKVGDKAPELKIDKWVKNGPVTLADGIGKKVYIVEFWATWCAPCRMSIPHLSSLQKKYADKGLVVVGISQEDAAVVEEFVKQQTDMDYNVGVDISGETYSAYMDGVQGIPRAYIVGKDGTILWGGHPLQMDEVLEQVMDGTFDPKAALAVEELKLKFQQALQSQDADAAIKVADEILKLDPEDQMALGFRLYVFDKNGDLDGAGTYMDQLISAHPNKSKLWFVRVDVAQKAGNDAQVREIISRFIKQFKSDPAVLNTMAWSLLDTKPFAPIPLDLAFKASKLSIEGITGDDKVMKAAYLDTLARCYYAMCQLDKAIETQTEALELMKGEKDAEHFEKLLKFYNSVGQWSKSSE